MKNENISYDTLMSLLIGDLKTKQSLAAVLNFLKHTTSVVRTLYWSKCMEEDLKKELRIKEEKNKTRR